MALKLKLSVGGSGGSGSSQTPKTSGSPEPTRKSRSSTPKIKIKPPKPEPEPEDVKTPKKIKLSLGAKNSKKSVDVKPARSVPRVRIKPTRVPGEGYDSEAPDIEDDPLIEQGMMIRFLDDTNLDFVHSACESGDYTGLNIKWISKDKAVVNVNGTLYSARMIDLPTVTEVFKTTDRKNIFKTLDISQMLLVIKKVDPEKLRKDKDFEVPQEKLYHHPLYKMAQNKEFKENRYVWRDGLLPPFEDVFRRFRPRKLNHRVMDSVDARVNELIKRDEDAEESAFEIVDPKKMNAGAPGTPGVIGTPTGLSSSNTPRAWGNGGQLSGTPSAVGTPVPPFADDLDEFEGVNLEEELNKVLDGSVGDDLFGGIAIEREEGDEDDGEEDAAEEPDEPEDDDDSDDDDDEDDDDDQHLKMLNEEIADLEKAVESNKRHLDSASSRMMRMKFQTSYNSLRQSLDQKKRALAKLLEEQRKSDPTSQQGASASAAAAAAAAGVATAGVDADGDDEEDDDDGDDDAEDGDDGDNGDDGETPAANGDDDDIELDEDNDIDDLFG